MVAVPCSVEELVTESENEDVLDHLLAEIVVDTEDLLLLPVRSQSLLQIARARKILAERLLDLLEGKNDALAQEPRQCEFLGKYSQ